MISTRHPAKDQVAIVSAATTGFVAKNTQRSQLSFATEASVAALAAAGLSAEDVDGIVGGSIPIGSSNPRPEQLQQALGIPDVTYFANPPIPIVNQLSIAVAAVYSGLCEVVLMYHAPYRLPWNSGSARKDPLRRSVGVGADMGTPDTVSGAVAYTAWASRYLYEFGHSREDLALVSLNMRSNASRNPNAAMRDPLTLEDYMGARRVREPLCVYDMDPAVDGADAFVITRAERARDLAMPPVMINAVTLGNCERPDETQLPGLRRNGQTVTVEALQGRSDFWIDECDVYFPYDGFSIICLNWLENVGYCDRGEAPAFMRDNWDEASNSVRINGRVPLNPHGGSLSEGASQGSGHLREAVHQLQGLAGERQVEGARRAIVTTGGLFFNAQGCTLRRE